MQVRTRVFMALGAMAVSAWMVIAALKWPLKTALFPVVIGIPVFLMALVEFLFSLYEKQEPAKKGKETLPPSEPREEKLPLRRILFGFLFGVFLFVLILSFGFPIAIPAFVFLYTKVYGEEKWCLSLGLTAAAWVSFYGLFVWLLRLPFEKGLLQQGLKLLGI